MARRLRACDAMIGKTTAAQAAPTEILRRAVSGGAAGAGQSFGAALEAQRRRLDPTSTPPATEPPAGTSARVPIGRAAELRNDPTASRTPVGSRVPDDPGREALTPARGAAAPPAAETTEGSARPNYATADAAVTTSGTLSEDPRTAGMYVPPDFYHGTSYSPVFDQQDENGNWVPTPRFEGQKIYSPWRGSLPDDFDPNARVLRDPLTFGNTAAFWKQNEDGTWSKRETGYGGIPLYENGKPVFTPDPSEFPEYYEV